MTVFLCPHVCGGVTLTSNCSWVFKKKKKKRQQQQLTLAPVSSEAASSGFSTSEASWGGGTQGNIWKKGDFLAFQSQCETQQVHNGHVGQCLQTSVLALIRHTTKPIIPSSVPDSCTLVFKRNRYLSAIGDCYLSVCATYVFWIHRQGKLHCTPLVLFHLWSTKQHLCLHFSTSRMPGHLLKGLQAIWGHL